MQEEKLGYCQNQMNLHSGGSRKTIIPEKIRSNKGWNGH